MSRSTARNQSTRTYTRYIIEPPPTIVSIKPPTRPSTGRSKSATKSQSLSATKPPTGKTQPAHRSVTIRPRKELHTGKSQPANGRQQTKKDATFKDQPTTDHLTANMQQLPPYPTHLHAVRIPCDGSPNRINKISLTKKGPGGLRAKDCVAIEDWLVCFPDMRSCYDQDPKFLSFNAHPDTFKFKDHPATFSFKDRCLIGIPAKDLDGSTGRTDYYLYCCYEKEADLPENTYLSRLAGVHMYGDAFPFKTEGFDEGIRPNFVHMRPGVKEQTLENLLTYGLRAKGD